MANYLEEEDLMPTDEELELMKRAQEAQGTGATWGGTIGSGLGALAGGLIAGIPTAGSAAIPGAALGASLGGGIGNAIGSGIGGWVSDEAEKELAAMQEARGEKQSAFDLREEALRRLLGTR